MMPVPTQIFFVRAAIHAAGVIAVGAVGLGRPGRMKSRARRLPE